jgi:hypothetical protein
MAKRVVRSVQEAVDAEARRDRLSDVAPELYEALRDALTMCETLAGACSDRVHGTGKEIYRLRQVLAKVDAP